jgi:hypothetical protein
MGLDALYDELLEKKKNEQVVKSKVENELFDENWRG